MKSHILAALREQFKRWEDLLSGMRTEQVSMQILPSPWTVKEVLAHLMAWQQLSSARVAAALEDREPVFPEWAAGDDPDSESPDTTNARILAGYRADSWPDIHQKWRAGYQGLLDLAWQVSERDLLDSDRYPWLDGAPLALILLASYDHHQEHFENLATWLGEQG